MHITQKQRQAIAKVLLDIIIADDIIDDKEIELLGKIQNQLGITDQEIEDCQSMDHNDALQLLGELSDADKDAVGTMMYEMIHSDGHADEVELIALQSICASTGILLPG